MTKYDPKDDPSSWQHDKRAHPGAPSAGVPGGPIPVSGPMTLEQHQWLHPRTANADFAAQQAQSGREARRAAVIEQFPVGSKAITSVASINRTEDVTGTVAGHKRGSVLLKTESHGVLAVEPNKLRFHGGGTS